MTTVPPGAVTIVASPNKPRPDDPLTLAIADSLRRIENNYAREGSGPGSRFEGRLLEDIQAQFAVRAVHAAERVRRVSAACDTGCHLDCPCCACTCHPAAAYPPWETP